MLIVREARPDDAATIQAIYAHHVLHGTASFEIDPPDLAFWHGKITDLTDRRLPFLVACEDANRLGYAYATPFRDRPAYGHTCENSIYVRAGHMGRGVGLALMLALIEAASATGFREMIAVIGGGEPASIALHARCGFVHAGRLRNVGYKFGRYLDTVYMQRSLTA